MNDTRVRSLELVLLVAILALAALLRVGWPGISEFKGDEARIALLALDLVEGKALPLKGTGTSVGLPKSPLSIYLYALPFLFSPNPLGATLFTGVLNTGAVFLCWWLGRRYWGRTAGLCAALLFAASPWAVFFSRKIWEPDLLPLFTTAWMLVGLLAFIEGRRWALTVHLILLAVLVQLHYSALVLVPLTVLMLILYRKRVGWLALGIGLGLSLLSGVPFLYYLLRGGSGIRQAISGLLSQEARLDLQSLRLWWTITSGNEVHSLAGPQAFRDFLRSVPYAMPVCWAAGLLAVGGIGFGLWMALRHKDEPPAQVAGLVALWGLAPLVVFLRHSTPLFLHYYVVSFPAQFLAAGLALARIISSTRPGSRWGATAGTLVIAVAQTSVALALLSFLGTRATPGGFGVPLGAQLQALRAARREDLPVVVASPGDNPQTSDWAAVFAVLLRRHPHRLVDGTYAACFPGSPSILLMTPGSDVAMRVYALSGVLGSVKEIPARSGEEPFRVARLEGEPSFALTPAQEPRVLSNGVEVLGYRWDGRLAPGETIEWWLAWRVAKPPPAPFTEYHVFNHLEDLSGKRWAQVDGPTTWVRDWAPGDVVVEVFRLEMPKEANPGPYHMRVGMYSYPGLQGQPVVDGAGNPVSDAVILEPLVAP